MVGTRCRGRGRHSFVACNLAHAFAGQTRASTLLMDLDVNCAPLTGFLDLNPERGLPAALAEVEFLDQHALAGYVTSHRSGLHLLGAPSKSTHFSAGPGPKPLCGADGEDQRALPLGSSSTVRCAAPS